MARSECWWAERTDKAQTLCPLLGAPHGAEHLMVLNTLCVATSMSSSLQRSCLVCQITCEWSTRIKILKMSKLKLSTH